MSWSAFRPGSKPYVTGLVAGHNKILDSISTHVLPVNSVLALNKFLTEYDWDEDQLNRERMELFQQADDTRWSSEGVVIVDDTLTHKTGEKIPTVGNSSIDDTDDTLGISSSDRVFALW